jgi:ABC-type nitrate/sulfonate/bicarbonate transport system substrate-binding protein
VALFCDATEVLFSIADRRRELDAEAPWVPRRHFVMDANEAHRIALEGTHPIVGMSLDDLLECSCSSHPKASELVAFMGVHRGFLRLMGSRKIEKISDLKGRRVAVDTDTGYASALFEMLRQHGLERGRDFEVVYAGATNLRYSKLIQGEFDATLLGAPFTRLAVRQGFPTLGAVIDAFGGYQAIVLVARRPWLAENAPVARAVATCLHQAFGWAARPENRKTVESFIRDSMPGIEPAAIDQIREDLFGSSTEFLTDGRLREADTRVVIDLFNASRGAAVTQQTVRDLTDPTAR